MKHYKFETSGESDLEKDGNLLTLKANIQPWEFVQFLSTGTIQEDIQPGKVMKGLMLSRVNSHETPSLVFLNSPPYCYLLVKGSYISCSRCLGRGRYILFSSCHVSFFFISKVYERSYLRIQREEYLQQQLALEKMASEIVFHTISITNALSPDEFFEQVSRPTIQSIFKQDPFGKLTLIMCT